MGKTELQYWKFIELKLNLSIYNTNIYLTLYLLM